MPAVDSTETPRLLLGPGPSNVSPRVLAAMGRPLLGHLDAAFLAILDEVQERLRRVFGTRNALTLPLSATGSAGMECCLVNLLEPGDAVVVGVAGVFGERMCEVARRSGARVTKVECAWGEALDAGKMRRAIARAQPRVVAMVHAETSTGVLQPVEEIARAVREAGALLVLDCVTSLGGVPVRLDDWGVDAAYSGTQKCLSCPPGLSPISFGERALQRVRTRERPVQSWFMDVGLLGAYYGGDGGGGARVYHHTAPISAIYALAEGLRMVEEEGMAARAERHLQAGRALVSQMRALGFAPLVAEPLRLPQLTTLRLPAALRGAAEAELRSRLLNEHGIEVGAGLGALAGEVWRIGLMGENAQVHCAERLAEALRALLA